MNAKKTVNKYNWQKYRTIRRKVKVCVCVCVCMVAEHEGKNHRNLLFIVSDLPFTLQQSQTSHNFVITQQRDVLVLAFGKKSVVKESPINILSPLFTVHKIKHFHLYPPSTRNHCSRSSVVVTHTQKKIQSSFIKFHPWWNEIILTTRFSVVK
jgi:hypothetical protein